MSTIAFDVTAFRTAFPALVGMPGLPSPYSDATLQDYWDTAVLYISDYRGGCNDMRLAQRTRCINLMTAHLIAISALLAAGSAPGVMTSATIDKISVTLEPPPVKNQWQYWLSTTAYGAQLLALLQVVGVGGIYVGGRAELSAFRKVGGVF